MNDVDHLPLPLSAGYLKSRPTLGVSPRLLAILSVAVISLRYQSPGGL